ncbi:pyruvoyl-dependent arginine decarboxylase [Limnochorda pilosa]|uniref:Pyruvoyl-dependent arginine decarboxylase AaxB n=1 Tax=Limnochorda pilosa TaxID=1555112 RepID=A0A0K2SPP8_LIMPI|nr:arginine decarboxylase, pyruvoyl-dependent [Limnochorda pilosa]BAS28977.1 pyruvoyl-dependent arginine decarboxylase [Limnochorda pilosa]
MLPTPKRFTLVAAGAEGPTSLNAFDHALLAAGVGNLNLIRVSSILPPGAEEVERLEVPPGSLLPIAYGSFTSEEPGTQVAAAVAVGLSRDSFGVIMEFGGRCSRDEAEAEVRRRVEEAFRHRGIPLVAVRAIAAEHRVERVGCAFAGCALWY